jgi:hypothetical protein
MLDDASPPAAGARSGLAIARFGGTRAGSSRSRQVAALPPPAGRTAATARPWTACALAWPPWRALRLGLASLPPRVAGGLAWASTTGRRPRAFSRGASAWVPIDGVRPWFGASARVPLLVSSASLRRVLAGRGPALQRRFSASWRRSGGARQFFGSSALGREWGEGESLGVACGPMTATPRRVYLFEGVIFFPLPFPVNFSGEILDHVVG